jgi:pilus assembly protein CpaF
MSLLKRIEQNQQPASRSQSGSASKMRELRVRRQSVAGTRDAHADIKTRVQNQLIAELDPKMDMSRTDEVRAQIEELFDQILAEENLPLSRAERQRLFESIVAEILGYGPIEPLLADDSVTEIMVNGAKQIYVERAGKLVKTNLVFESDDHAMRIIDRIVAPLGRRVDESSPYVDARLPDGSRVNAIIPPLSINGPTLTIRKFSKTPLTIQNLVEFGSITSEAVEFLRACVIARLNVVVSGGTGSGKTTLLNILSGFIPEDERIVTVENAAELQLRQDHVVTLESRPPNIEGKGEVTIRDLVINCLRMRPDRIVVGECRGGEALDMLQAMNTGHDGSLTTAHANSPRDTLSRLETMCLMSGMDLPVRAIREQVAAAVDLIVQQERMRDGSRKVVNITEVQGMEGDVIVMQDIFAFEQTGIEAGKVIGRLKPTGIRPKFMDRIEAANIHLPPNIFGIGQQFRY